MREASWFDIFLLKIGLRQRVRVAGDSMLPILKNGDEVLVKPGKSYQPGEIVVTRHPYKNIKIIKRITEFSTGGKLFLRGDNPAEGSDSRTFGGVEEKDILGRVVCLIKTQ